MATSRGIQLAQQIRQKVAALKEVCGEVDENLTGQAPGRRGGQVLKYKLLCDKEMTWLDHYA